MPRLAPRQRGVVLARGAFPFSRSFKLCCLTKWKRSGVENGTRGNVDACCMPVVRKGDAAFHGSVGGWWIVFSV